MEGRNEGCRRKEGRKEGIRGKEDSGRKGWKVGKMVKEEEGTKKEGEGEKVGPSEEM